MGVGFERVEYRLPDGHKFEYLIDKTRGITTHDIDRLACMYFEHTGKFPETVFIRYDLYRAYLQSTADTMKCVGIPEPSGFTVTRVWLTIGMVQVKPIVDAYIPLLVGTQQDYDDNDLNWLFEEIVLADCERE
jgi:hypothetical protein